MEADRPLGRGAAHPLWPLFVLVVGAAVLVLVLAHPAVDESWENHPAHFWLVLTAASLSVGLGYAVGAAARRRRDARLFLVSLATLNFLFVAKAIRSNSAQLGKYQRRAEGFFAGSWILLMLEPTLILVTVGVYFAAAVALALWVLTIFAFGSGLREAS